MFQNINSIINWIYEYLTYHISYKLDDNENIVITERNPYLKSQKLITAVVVIIGSFIIIAAIGMVSKAIVASNDNTVFINRYYAKEICIENSQFTECFSSDEIKRFRLYMINDSFPILYIKED